MHEAGLTKNQIIAELTRSSHGKLQEYVPLGRLAAVEEPEFLAHLIAWNHVKGQVRDSKVALPVVSLSTPVFPLDFRENSFAHAAILDPRNFLRAYRFAMEIKIPGQMRELRRLAGRYLRSREEGRGFERVAVQHRRSLKELYALGHVKPSEKANNVLFKGIYRPGSIFDSIRTLKDMPVREAAGTILERKIPFLVAVGALGSKAKDPDLVLALIERMSATELVTNTKMLERLGVKTVPALRAAYEQGLNKAAGSKANILKTTRAAEALEDEGLKEKLRGLQERQIQALGGIEGNWLVLGDKSGSMSRAIESARVVASTLAKMVKGSVHLVFFDVYPRYINATGKSYDALLAETKHIQANGGTSIGCGVQYALECQLDLDGIAVVSDGGENHLPSFADAYRRYEKLYDKALPVYFYRVSGGDADAFSGNVKRASIDMQVFDLAGVDFYSLPNIVETMRASRYSLVDEIMAAPLLTLDRVFETRQEVVYA